ncbi:MAG: hypothetical protein LCH39_13095, partial [Proteobacteria bacterium]|nr:hypothetical protein [Pseudomonadota bacterium]
SYAFLHAFHSNGRMLPLAQRNAALYAEPTGAARLTDRAGGPSAKCARAFTSIFNRQDKSFDAGMMPIRPIEG